MPRILDLELSGGKLALRVVLAAVFAVLAALLFYYVPASIGSFAKSLGGASNASTVESVVNSLVSPNLPMIGLAAAAMVFVGVLLRGSRVYGPILVVTGAVFLAYVYVAFQGGTISLDIPQGQQLSLAGSVSIGLSGLMFLFMLAPLLTIVKGVVLTVMKPGEAPKPA